MNNQIDFVLPALYDKFLSEMGDDGEFNLEDTGIILYSKANLVERNTTYQIEEWEPDYFMIGQDGDLAFFIKKDSDDTIYKNDLGALGSIQMEIAASDVYEFIKQSDEVIDFRDNYKSFETKWRKEWNLTKACSNILTVMKT